VRRIVTFASLVAVYFASGKLGLSLAFVHESATAVWPPSGIALAALLVLGLRVWPALLAGAFLVNITTSGDLPSSIAIAAGNTLEGIVAAWLVMRYANGRRAFERAVDILRFTVFGAIAAPVIAATVGTTALVAFGLAARADYASIWGTWWCGDAVGAIVFPPLILLWPSSARAIQVRARPIEGAALALTTGLVSAAIFGDTPLGRLHEPLEFLVVPLLLWAALRFGAFETAVTVVFMGAIAFSGTIAGYGPFVRPDPNAALLLFQAFLGFRMPVLLAVAAEVAARTKTEAEVRRLNEDLEARVRERTEALLRSQEHLTEAQQIGQVGSWEWDIPQNVLRWSEELYRLYGATREQAASYEAFLGFVHPEDREAVRTVVARTLATHTPFSVEHRIVRPDGEVRVMHGQGRVVVNEAGDPVRMVGTGQDVTERWQATEERAQLLGEQMARRRAEEANKAKDEFLATLSHELRTPLNAALGWAHMLRTMPLDEHRRTKVTDAIHRNLLLQARLVSDILDVTRMSIGSMRIEQGLAPLAAVMAGAVEMVQELATSKNVAIHISPAAWSVILPGDESRLQQVIWNLLANAVKFAKNGGRVDVDVVPAGGSVTIAIQDDGPGIDPAFLPHVFEQFRQADPSPTREHSGLGLGLAIASHIVELHGGTIVASNTPGSGARFTICLPAASATMGS
jgi:PAS domain S-box-containing protein